MQTEITGRIALLDNDVCALNFISQLLLQHGIRDRDILATSKPAWAVQYCRLGGQAPDALITDMALNGITGAQVACEARKAKPSIGIIGITSYDMSGYLQSCMDAGMQALLDKSELNATIIPTLRAVLRGKPYPSGSSFLSVEQAQAAMAQETKPKPHLTETERMVMAAFLSGKETPDVARQFGLSASTVYAHRRNICVKLGVRKWHEALDRCRQLHIF